MACLVYALSETVLNLRNVVGDVFISLDEEYSNQEHLTWTL